MHIPKRYLLYQQKYVAPYVNMLLQVVSFFAHLAAVALIVCATLEFGFELSAQLRHEFAWLYFCVYNVSSGSYQSPDTEEVGI